MRKKKSRGRIQVERSGEIESECRALGAGCAPVDDGTVEEPVAVRATTGGCCATCALGWFFFFFPPSSTSSKFWLCSEWVVYGANSSGLATAELSTALLVRRMTDWWR